MPHTWYSYDLDSTRSYKKMWMHFQPFHAQYLDNKIDSCTQFVRTTLNYASPVCSPSLPFPTLRNSIKYKWGTKNTHNSHKHINHETKIPMKKNLDIWGTQFILLSQGNNTFLAISYHISLLQKDTKTLPSPISTPGTQLRNIHYFQIRRKSRVYQARLSCNHHLVPNLVTHKIQPSQESHSRTTRRHSYSDSMRTTLN